MHIQCLQHVRFEGPANIETWAKGRGHEMVTIHVYRQELPQSLDFDMLVIMGGPMSVNDESELPWLVKEKRFIERAMKEDKIVLGICLGAQLIANVLGAKVYRNKEKEIGWSSVAKVAGDHLFRELPNSFTAFHWHGETFDLPKGAKHLAKTEACTNQAFQYGDKVLGLQFHLESTERSIKLLIENCAGDFTAGPFVQTPAQMKSELRCLGNLQKNLFSILDKLSLRVSHEKLV